MKTVIAAIAVFISLSAISYSVAATCKNLSASDERAEDEAAIHKIVSRMQEGWNKGDGKAFAAPFAEDADYVIVNGVRIKGRDVIAAGHQRIFDTVYKNSHITPVAPLSIRFVRDDVAIVHIEWHLKYRQGEGMREDRATNSLVLTKDKGQWSITAFHNTPITSDQK